MKTPGPAVTVLALKERASGAKALDGHSGDWRWNGKKRWRDKQGTSDSQPSGVHGESARRTAPKEVRAPVVAMKSGQAGRSQGAQESGSEMDQTNEKKIDDSGGKQREPKQVEEARTLPEWVERAVWTDRMWQRLETSQG